MYDSLCVGGVVDMMQILQVEHAVGEKKHLWS